MHPIPKDTSVAISRVERGNGHVRILLGRTVYPGPVPRTYRADEINQFNMEDPCYPEEMSDTGRALVDHFIYHGNTGVTEVNFVSPRVVEISHDPILYPVHDLENDVRTLVRYVDRFGYAELR